MHELQVLIILHVDAFLIIFCPKSMFVLLFKFYHYLIINYILLHLRGQ